MSSVVAGLNRYTATKNEAIFRYDKNVVEPLKPQHSAFPLGSKYQYAHPKNFGIYSRYLLCTAICVWLFV